MRTGLGEINDQRPDEDAISLSDALMLGFAMFLSRPLIVGL